MNEVTELFRRLTQGVYVIGVADGNMRDAFTAAWVMQVSFEPLLLALSINPDHASYPLLHSGGGFTVNILKRDQQDLALRFGTRSGRDEDKLLGVPWHAGRTGAPILEDALAYFDCELTGEMGAGDHELALGRVTGGRLLDPDAEPLLYRDTGDMDDSSALYPRKL
ncbi:MAG TPA: flavin reductase family protein [Gemmatimonadales bacterium]|nr:flavin reductase family protein [Gemmatimonadales bacterium]